MRTIEETLNKLAEIIPVLSDKTIKDLYLELETLNEFTKQKFNKSGLYPKISLDEFLTQSIDDIKSMAILDCVNFSILFQGRS